MLRCPGRCIDSSVASILGAFGRYKAGFLPEVGGWLDQSAAYVEAMDLMERIVGKHQKIEMGGGRDRE